jgi:hypothetical protein
MRRRETITQWNALQEGDEFLRYTQSGAVRMLVVLRNAEDLPQDKGAIGYATVDLDGSIMHDVLVIRRLTGQGGSSYTWVAPFITGPGRSLSDNHLVDFKPMTLVGEVLPGDIRDAIRTGIHEAGTESLGRMIEVIEREILAMLTGQ